MGLFALFGTEKKKTPDITKSTPVKKRPPVSITGNGTVTCSCPFCGYEITKDNILFVNPDTEPYRDLRKYCFLKLCASQWDLSDQFTNKTKAPGLYYRLEDALEGTADFDGELPISIEVHPHTGKTPTELEAEGLAHIDSPLTDFIQMYKNKNPLDNLTEDASVAGSTVSFGAAAFGAATFGTTSSDEGETHSTDEIKPYDDGSSMTLADRVCPNCHSLLHQEFGVLETFNITMLGGTSSGKTAYLVALVQGLKTQLGPRDLGVATLLPASEYYYQHLYSACRTANGTAATQKDEKLFPLVFYYINKEKKCFLCFYDIAGENTLRPSAMKGHRGVMEATTLLLMIDPNQLNNGSYFKMLNASADGGYDQTYPDAAFPSTETAAAFPGTAAPYPAQGAPYLDALNSIDIGTCFNQQIGTYLAQSISMHARLKILQNVKHVIVVLTKMDMPLRTESDLFGSNDLFIKYPLQRDHHKGGVHRNVIDRIAHELDVFLKFKTGHDENDDYSFINEVASFFPPELAARAHFDLLGVSTHTRIIKEDLNDMEFVCNWDENAAKHRVIEPFLLILAENGIINFI